MARILVVDDDEVFRTFMREALSSLGHEVVLAKDGQEAREACEDINLLITDLVMPNKNGLDLIMEIIAEKPDLPILAVSGGGGITGRFDYLEISRLIGADAILTKPFQLAELREKVSQLLADNKDIHV